MAPWGQSGERQLAARHDAARMERPLSLPVSPRLASGIARHHRDWRRSCSAAVASVLTVPTRLPSQDGLGRVLRVGHQRGEGAVSRPGLPACLNRPRVAAVGAATPSQNQRSPNRPPTTQRRERRIAERRERVQQQRERAGAPARLALQVAGRHRCHQALDPPSLAASLPPFPQRLAQEPAAQRRRRPQPHS